MTTTETKPWTNDLKAALLTAHGKTLQFKGRKYKLECREAFSRYLNRYEFSVHAVNLTPQTPLESKFCYWDLWHSEANSAESSDPLFRFANLGGYSFNH